MSDDGAELSVVRVDGGPGVVRFAVAGELDLLAAPLFTAQVHAAEPDEGDLVLDLAGVTFLDSSGLAALLRLREEVHAAGASFALVPSAAVRRTIDVAGLTDLFELSPEAR